MTDTTLAFPQWDDLAAFVRTTLCELDHLDPEGTPFFRTAVFHGGRMTGYVFHLEGPRLLRTSAVWSMKDGRLVVYDSTGQKVRQLNLSVGTPVPTESESLRRVA